MAVTMKRKGPVQPEQPGVILGGPGTQAINVESVNGTNPLENLARLGPPASVLQPKQAPGVSVQAPQAAPASPAMQAGPSAAPATQQNRSKHSILNRLQMPGRRA